MEEVDIFGSRLNFFRHFWLMKFLHLPWQDIVYRVEEEQDDVDVDAVHDYDQDVGVHKDLTLQFWKYWI